MSTKNRKSRNKKTASVSQRPDTGPIDVGRRVRRISSYGNDDAMVTLIAGIWAQYAQRLGGSSDISWNGLGKVKISSKAVMQEIECLSFNITSHERRISDDEELGVFACNSILEAACNNLDIFYVEI